MSYTPKQDSDVDCLHWHALNYRTAGLDAQGAWVELEAYFDKQIKEAYQAGRASRDSEVEALKLEEAFLQRTVTRRNEFCKLLQESLDQSRLEAEGVEALRADAERYRFLQSNAYVGIAHHPKPHEVWCLRLPNPKDAANLDQAIDAARKEK